MRQEDDDIKSLLPDDLINTNLIPLNISHLFLTEE